ncbi:hypothetical protein K474DRAFT_1305766 [Panus rudis PR-1116 ss-1]|nr:hypothetical protein K474DRAFT_1305766 [Panus rudis PR-1116 ss-1]
MVVTSAPSQDAKTSSVVAQPTDKSPVTHPLSTSSGSSKPTSAPASSNPAASHSSAGNTAPSSPSKPAASSAGSQAPTPPVTEVASHTPSSGATGKPAASSPSAGSKSSSAIRAPTSPAVTPVSADHSLSPPTAVKSNVSNSVHVSPSRVPIAVASSPAAARASQAIGSSPVAHSSPVVSSPAVLSSAKGKPVPSLTHVTQGSSATPSDAPSQGAASRKAVSSDAPVPASSSTDFSSFRGQANAQTPVVSTVTQFPETTLSTPVFVSVTNAKGQVSLSEPPFFTSVTVQTSDGQLVSVTHVIANPTGIWGVNDNAGSTTGYAQPQLCTVHVYQLLAGSSRILVPSLGCSSSSESS